MKLAIPKQMQDYASEIGFPLESVLERAGIPNILWKEKLELSPLEYYRFLLEINELVSDDQIIAMSDLRNMGAFMPSFFVALCARNASEGFERFAAYKRLICPLNIKTVKTDDALEVYLSFDIPDTQMMRFSVLSGQLDLISLIRTGTGKQIIPVRVGSSYEYSSHMTDIIGIQPEKMEGNMIAFRREDCEIPFITQNNVMIEYLEPELKRRLDEISVNHSFIAVLQKALFSAIPGGRFSREDMAQSLGISVRSMQRKLSLEGTTYQREVQSVQKMLALSHINDTKMSLEEICCLVGYSEQSAFSRAFKNWTGMTISQYRKEKEKQ